MTYYTTYKSPLGELILRSDGEGLKTLYLKEKIQGRLDLEKEIKEDSLPIFTATKDRLEEYFKGENPSPGKIKLNPEGTDFQKKVRDLLKEIPYGETSTYGDLSEKFEERENRRTSPRAIGSAIGKNPLLIVIPCHRVLGKNGSLTGYAAGLENKVSLLKLEEVDLTGVYNPLTRKKL